MGFYVNVEAKNGCAGQINKLWEQSFGGFLIFTKSKIQKEIDYIQKDPKQEHLRYVKTISSWNKTFPIHSFGRGQVFLRAFGYSEEDSENFIEENEELKNKIKFILDNRMLFKSISGLFDAVDTLDMDIKGNYIENGQFKELDTFSFENLPQKHQNPVFIAALKADSPKLWQYFLDIDENGLNNNNWFNIRNLKPAGATLRSKYITIWQRCEEINDVRTQEKHNLLGAFNKDVFPNEFDLVKAIILSDDDFNDYLEQINPIKQNTTRIENNVTSLSAYF